MKNAFRNMPLLTNLKPVNRGQRRLLQHEWTSATMKLSAAEEVFYDLMTRADDYNEAYIMGRELYENACNRLNLKYFVINPMYFYNSYRPEEYFDSYPVIHKLFEWLRKNLIDPE